MVRGGRGPLSRLGVSETNIPPHLITTMMNIAISDSANDDKQVTLLCISSPESFHSTSRTAQFSELGECPTKIGEERCRGNSFGSVCHATE